MRANWEKSRVSGYDTIAAGVLLWGELVERKEGGLSIIGKTPHGETRNKTKKEKKELLTFSKRRGTEGRKFQRWEQPGYTQGMRGGEKQ